MKNQSLTEEEMSRFCKQRGFDALAQEFEDRKKYAASMEVAKRMNDDTHENYEVGGLRWLLLACVLFGALVGILIWAIV
jgi:hypothetical protein